MENNPDKIKRKLILIFLVVLLLCGFIIMNYSSTSYTTYQIQEIEHKMTGQATIIDDATLLELSTLNSLYLNITKLPIVTVDTDYTYVIEGEDGINRGRPQIGDSDKVQQPIRSITFSGLPFDQKVDIEVTAMFENCGTLNDKNIDMKIIYSDFYSAPEYTGTSSYLASRSNSKVLWWTAYGTIDDQTANNEWFQRGFQNINAKFYFYYHGETTPIPLNIAYFTLYSEDGNDAGHSEAASSKIATKAFLFEETTMAYQKSLTLGSSTYNDVFYGTVSANSSAPKKAAVSFQYKNTNYVDVDMHILVTQWSAGYHINFSALTATLPDVGNKSVSETEVRPGTDLTYTINQKLPTAVDDKFTLSSMVFTDELNENLTYKSLKVYNENNTDITSTAGINSVTNNVIVYTFNADYLKNISYTGQNYKFVIETTMKDVPTTGQITNSAVVNYNNASSLVTNSIPTDIISYIHIKRIDENGVEIVNTETIKGNIYDKYTTEAKEIERYELIAIPDNANGTYDLEDKTITYVYKKIIKDVEVYKIWEDNNSDTRPNSINVILSSDANDETQTVELNSENGWYYKFIDMKKFNDETGTEINYTVTENVIPEGYYISNSVTENNVTTITNTKYGKITINKFDNSTKIPLANATFKVEKQNEADSEIIGEFTTNENGIAIVKNLKQGLYKITEIHAPEGYKLNTEIYEVDQIKVVEPENTKDIEIIEGKEFVTLLTCVPYGINSHRLLVRGIGIDESNILEDKLVENKSAKENPEIKKEIDEKTDKNIIIDVATIIEKIRIALVIIILIIIIIIKLYIDDYDRRIKRKIKRVRENNENIE